MKTSVMVSVALQIPGTPQRESRGEFACHICKYTNHTIDNWRWNLSRERNLEEEVQLQLPLAKSVDSCLVSYTVVFPLAIG